MRRAARLGHSNARCVTSGDGTFLPLLAASQAGVQHVFALQVQRTIERVRRNFSKPRIQWLIIRDQIVNINSVFQITANREYSQTTLS